MKRSIYVVSILTVFLLFSVSTIAFATTTVVTNTTGSWQAWPGGDPNNDGTPYWDNPSWDGTTAGIGWYLTGGSGPGAIPYWGVAGGGYDSNFYFQTDSAQMAALKIEIAGYAGVNSFGWIENDATVHELFSGAATAGATATFTPTASFAFYLISGNGDRYCTAALSPWQTADSGLQHFALFQDGQDYWLGVEDLRLDSSDKDYNDFVIKVSQAPVPIPAAVWLLGTGLLGLFGVRRKITK